MDDEISVKIGTQMCSEISDFIVRMNEKYKTHSGKVIANYMTVFIIGLIPESSIDEIRTALFSMINKILDRIKEVQNGR